MGGGGSDKSVLNKVTGGLNSAMKFVSGYDADSGEWSTHGSQFQPIDEGLGAVTGRNVARSQLNLARDQFNASQKQAADLIAQNNWNKLQADQTASSSAAAATASARATSGVNPNNSTPIAIGTNALGTSGAPQKDFLGL